MKKMKIVPVLFLRDVTVNILVCTLPTVFLIVYLFGILLSAVSVFSLQ